MLNPVVVSFHNTLSAYSIVASPNTKDPQSISLFLILETPCDLRSNLMIGSSFLFSLLYNFVPSVNDTIDHSDTPKTYSTA